ncbi:MAG: SMEK domain-containing protein, partial [Bacteroidales bacterium]|nr:SMEK domain-containing protein [Bacteroidales bacterium]
MSQLKRYCEQIGRILTDYKSFLNLEAKASLFDNHKYSEYLFKQLLNLVYNWDLKHTEEKYLTNTSGIDLFSSKNGGYSVQITAQNKGQDKKVTDTISDYNDKWKVKYKFLKILFIQDNVNDLRKKYNTSDKLVEVFSFKELLVTIKNLDDLNKVKKILDFLKQELGNELSIDRPLKGFRHFEEKMKGKIFYSISNTEAFKNGLLYYTNYEEFLIEKLGGIFEDKNKKALIEGPPCSGKTSLLFGLNATLDKKLIKCHYVNLEEWNQEYEAEIFYFKGIDSLLIIDNAHIDRYEIAKNIYQVCDENKINVLFISRDNNSQKLLNSSLNRFDFDLLESFTTAFDKDEQIKLKIKGIVENRLSYLSRVKPNISWSVGDIEEVYKNSELSLLKTAILLNYWEQKYSNKQLQDVQDNDCYKEFFNEHIHKKMDYEVVFKYSSIYKFECPFKLINISDTIQQQIDNGIFIDTKRNLLYKFPHTEYAQLLSKSIKFERNIDNRYETAQILNYIIEAKPENIHILIEGLLNGKHYAHLDFILSDYYTNNFIFNHYSTRKDNIDLKLLLFGLNDIRKELSNENSKNFVTRLIESLQDFNLISYEKAGEEIIEKANEVADFYKITKRPRYRQIDGSNRFKSKSFFELSELITKNRKNRPFVTKIALSLKYSEWKTKFQQYDGNYSKKIEGLANLNKEPITRQLAFDLYELLDTNEIFRNLEDSSIDVFGKAINNLSNFYNIDGRKKPKELLKLFKKKEKFENQTQYGLSKYAIGLSHINQIDNEFIQELYPGDKEIIELFSDASANDLAQRIPLFIKCFPSKNETFISIIRSKLSNDSFYSQQNNNLQGFTELAHV